MVKVGYGCCVGSWDKLRHNVVPWVRDRPLMAISGQSGIARPYNQILNWSINQGHDLLVLLHDDLQVLLEVDATEETLLDATGPAFKASLVGVIGGVEAESLHWWNSPTIVGRQLTDSGLVGGVGPREGQVLFIDGSFMALSTWAIRGVRFDERYPGFCGYDDICMQVRQLSGTARVVDIPTHHHTTVGWKSDRIRQEFDECERLFQLKWKIGAGDRDET